MSGVTVDLDAISDLNPLDPKLLSVQGEFPSLQNIGPSARRGVKEVCKLISKSDSNMGLAMRGTLKKHAEHAPVAMKTSSPPKHFAVPAKGASDSTFTLGPKLTGSFLATASAAGGVLFTTATPSIDLFGNFSIGIGTGIGASLVAAFGFYPFSPAFIAHGRNVTVAVTFKGPGAVPTGGLALTFKMLPKPLLIGGTLLIGGGVGASLLAPVNITVTTPIWKA